MIGGKITSSRETDLQKSSFLAKKRIDMVGINNLKIEDGLIKYEYGNKFHLRVNNYRRAVTSFTKSQ